MTKNTKKWKNTKNGKSVKIENYRKSTFPENAKNRKNVKISKK